MLETTLVRRLWSAVVTGQWDNRPIFGTFWSHCCYFTDGSLYSSFLFCVCALSASIQRLHTHTHQPNSKVIQINNRRRPLFSTLYKVEASAEWSWRRNGFWCSCCCCYYLIRGVVCLLACSLAWWYFYFSGKRGRKMKKWAKMLEQVVVQIELKLWMLVQGNCCAAEML